MPGIEELLRVEGEHWRTEVDAHHQPAAAAAAAAPAAPAPAAAAARPDRRPWATPRGRVWTVSIGGVAAAAVAVLAVGLSSGSGSDGNSARSKVAGGTEFQGRASAAGSAAARASGGGGGIAAPAASGTAPVSTALILTGSLSLTVPDNAAVDRAATRATGIADGVGGRVDADSRSADGAGRNRSATLVLRVPNTALPAVTTQLSALGTVASQELQTKDVTAQVADVDSRVMSARAAIAALDRLYAKAQSVKDLITVESALAARQSDLEALEAQQRSLTAQTSLATLNLSIDVRAPAVVKHHQHRSGFTGGLHHGWHAFTATAGALATAAGAVLPFAVLILLAGAATVVVRRRRRPHSSA